MKWPDWAPGVVLLIWSSVQLQGRDQPWTRLDLPHFTVISEASPADTLDWAVQFEQFHNGMGRVLVLQEKLLRPVTVVLFASQSDLRPFKPLEKGRPAKVDGYFSRAPLGNYIAAASEDHNDITRHLIFHEGVHWLTSTSDVPLPPWLAEGLAEVYATFTIKGDSYSYGEVVPWHVLTLNRARESGQIIPLKELIAIAPGSLRYNEGSQTGIFYAESWAFVHYLLFSDRFNRSGKFNELVHALRPGMDPDGVFQNVFGVDCAAMDRELRAYLSNGSYNLLRLKFDRAGVEREARSRPATAAEVELAQGSLLLCVVRPAEAMPRLLKAAAAMPGDVRVIEALGMGCIELKQTEQARDYLQQAAAQGSNAGFVYGYLGDVLMGFEGSDSMRINPVNAQTARQAIAYYHRDLTLDPLNQRAYDNLAEALNKVTKVTLVDARDLAQGARLYPDDVRIHFGQAVGELKMGYREAGIARLEQLAADRAPIHSLTAVEAQATLRLVRLGLWP